ncbi:MAG TPA: response regulator [Eubacteriales bacterium]|nr:response regulator [Eubacteriales bacterium]
MRTILVDDMELDMRLLELKCAGMPDFEIVGKFTDPAEALAFAGANEVDFAMLDIDMPGMNGIDLAMRLREIRGDIIIVFVTAHPRFAVEAFRMKADYMVFKPFDRDDIRDVLERAKLLQSRQKKRVRFHTFGSFEMLVGEKPVRFHSAKAKELMALCVYNEGRPVSIYAIIEALCEGSEDKNAANTGYRRTIKELLDTLRECGEEEIFVRERGSCRIRRELVSCDYYDFWSGAADAVSRFDGRFMSDYAWAEPAIYRMFEKKGHAALIDLEK